MACSPPKRTRSLSIGLLCVLSVLRLSTDAQAVPSGVDGPGGAYVAAQEPPSPQTVSAASLQTAIDSLGKLDYETRTKASRLVRRTPANQAVPALINAVRSHEDGYVKYRALVLLTGFNDPDTTMVMHEAKASPNDRLRTVAYEYFEHHPNRELIPEMLASLDTEDGEFVRPSLVRALAALGSDPRVSTALLHETGRGEDFFRSAVIEALGDYKAAYAIDALAAVTKLDGPLLDDSVLALGKIGDQRALETLAGLQRTAPPALQPIVAASLCLVGTQCAEQEKYLIDLLKRAGTNGEPQENVRADVTGLTALALAGRSAAAEALFEVGAHAPNPVRAPIALGVATIALRNSTFAFALLEKAPSKEAITLLGEGFDMLEEDFEKEQFFALARKTYWNAPEGSPTRALMQTLIGELDF
jgi:HEAT repeat protein